LGAFVGVEKICLLIYIVTFVKNKANNLLKSALSALITLTITIMKTSKTLTILTILFCSTLTYAQRGSLDTIFNPGTGTHHDIHAISIQSDGKIVIGGTFTSYNGKYSRGIARLNSDGSLDSTFNTGMGVDGQITTISIQDDGKIIIGGHFTEYNGTNRKCITRLNTDGSIDLSFNPGSGASTGGGQFLPEIQTTKIQSDGKIIIGGIFNTFNGAVKNNIARLNTNGSLDHSFSSGMGVYGGDLRDNIAVVTIQSDEKIIIAGHFKYYNGTLIKNIARINKDGSIDTTFAFETGSRDIVYHTALQSDGKIVTGGWFNEFNDSFLFRLNVDGSLDSTFNMGTGPNWSISSILTQSDDKIIIGGGFTAFNGKEITRIARLNADGSLDTTFVTGTGVDKWIYSIAIQNDSRIIIGGEFTYYDGTPRKGIARINAFDFANSIPSIKEYKTPFNIFPNPFSTQTTIQSEHFIQNGTLTIYNSLGEVVSQMNNINGQSITIERGNLANGLYFIHLTEGSQKHMMKKVIIVD